MNSGSENVSCPTSSTLVAQLAGGSIGINSLTISNQSNGAVNVYIGATVGGTPLVVPPGVEKTLVIANASALCVTFAGSAGNVYVAWNDQPLSSTSSTVQAVQSTQFPAYAVITPTSAIVKSSSSGHPVRNYNVAVVGGGQPTVPGAAKPATPPVGVSVVFYVEHIQVSGVPDDVFWTLVSAAPGSIPLAPNGPLCGYGSGLFDFSACPIPLTFETFNGSAPQPYTLYAAYCNTAEPIAIGDFLPYVMSAQGYVE